jgi:phosphoglycerol transferase MdoB-like AlkP superfamily enzyme
MYQFNFIHLVKLIFINMLIAVFILGLARLTLLINIVDMEQLSIYQSDLFNVFFLGARYDLKVAAIAFALAVVTGLIVAIHQQSFKKFLTIFVAYAAVIHFLLVLFSVINYFYYQTYSNHIDVFIFGLKDDDTYAVLKSVWSDYPVIKALMLTLFIGYLTMKTNQYLVKKQSVNIAKFNHLAGNITCVFMLILVVFISARGTLGTHPLKRYQANVSDYIIFNKVTPNALVLFKWANTDYKKQAKFSAVNKDDFTRKVREVLGTENLQKSTVKNEFLENNPPHVVIALMESLGSSVLTSDGQNEQLLGSLQSHFNEDFLFTRFYAQTHGTIDTLVDMLVHSNVSKIGSSDAQKVVIPEAAMFAYQQAGYETIFLYGGNAMWRNIYNYFPRQGFSKIYNENSIMSHFPEAKKSKGDWGVADEYTFKLAQKLLQTASKPTVIYIMTVTNHSPHSIPNNASESKIDIDAKLVSFSNIKGKKLANMLQTYRYSADILGDFISESKASPLGSKTIIAASGDHRIRSMYMDSNTQRAQASQVPFYIYIPTEILSNVDYAYRPLRVGSHKDLFPTLYSFSLSNQQYSSLGGNNLLSSDENVNYWGYSAEGVFNQDGAYLKSMPGKSMAWLNDINQFSEAVIEGTIVTPTAEGYSELKTMFINQAIKGNN